MDFDLKKVFYGGFNFAKSNYVLIWVNGFIAICATVLAAVTIIGILVIPAIWAGFTESLLRLRRGEEVKMGVFFKAGFNQWGAFFILFLLLFLGLLAGFALLVIGLDKIADGVFYVKKPEKPGYKIEVENQ